MIPLHKREFKEPVSILMPVHNEALVIENVLAEWYEQVFKYLPPGSELIVDEAGSNDGTKEILQFLSHKYTFLTLNFHDKKEGFAVSALRLYFAATTPWVFFTDADGQYVPSEFWKLAEFAKDFDIVHGAKYDRKDPYYRRLASFVFNFFVKQVFRTSFSDINSAFRLMKLQTTLPIIRQCNKMPTLVNAELLLRCIFDGIKIKEVSIMHRTRQVGGSRGLPLRFFLRESYKALRGINALKKELL